MRNYLLAPKNRPSTFVLLDSTRKKAHKNFSLGRLPFFPKICVSATCSVLKKRSSKFHCNCQNSLWTLVNCFLSFVTLDNTRIIEYNFLSSLKHLFLKRFFYRPLRSQRNDFIICTIFVKTPRRRL